MWFLSASRRVFLTKLHDSLNCSSQQCPVFDESFEEATSRFHEIFDFLIDQTTGSALILIDFMGAWMSGMDFRVSLNVLSLRCCQM